MNIITIKSNPIIIFINKKLLNNIENEQISDLKNVLTDFILEQMQFNWEQRQFNVGQKQFNAEQKLFNAEQEQFNRVIDEKIDKVKYFLEETIADNIKMLFEEQAHIRG